MARNKKDIPLRTTEQLRGISDYYKLNTKSVEDLVTANKENSPVVPESELKKYRSKLGIHLPDWVKAVLIKAWFAGAACFFIFWGLGIYIQNTLDMMLVFGLALGFVMDLLENSIFRFMAVTPTSNDKWMMFPKKKYLNLFFNILYAFVLLFCVYSLYQMINGIIVSITGAKDTVPLGVEPILFGIFYMGIDMLFLGIKHLLGKILNDAKSAARPER